ncbi:hypothetical protein PoMZ_04596 [Pyricularia oryzae]|uniref:DNA ligase n=1 Tax=Pyricularia oryzae TaxID=318829 RepID=A0A4P7NDW9_PYROR|nr:hypothetical protein PoMZ_04596 [Pyricularia oryzae]
MSRIKREDTSQEAVDEDSLQYSFGDAGLGEVDEKYPNRPRNHSQTLVFSELFTNLFNPLNEHKNRRGPGGPAGRKGGPRLSPHEQRRLIIRRFIDRWRSEVGNDFYPALRLILPDKDRDRGVYGLKESAIGKLLVKLIKIAPDSEDGQNLLKWKLPGQTFASRMAGDFAGRCFETLSKRQMRMTPGDMRIGEVNSLLDKLAAASGEAEQLPIFQTFYERMNAEEMMWLIRMILKAMKIGASERTFLYQWHPDAEALFNVSSSLRRVCWELYDPALRLEQEDTRVTLMQCFQPQLAQFQPHSPNFATMVQDLGVTDEDRRFWIEEKLDGERMQLHMIDDDDHPGGKRFSFWSRKGKDYTYLYGNGFQDDNSALTRHLSDAFDPRVSNLILDGEMVTWDPKIDKMVPFGTLKTAALLGQKTPFDDTNERPLFRIFDILYLNDTALTKNSLQDRRKALAQVVRDVHRRLEIHPYEEATSADAVEPLLRKVVADSSEGLVLKNPRSVYRLNSRNNDWIKVKPEYMSEFGESLDCVVIGGYYGSGHRGGTISSFLCGLRVGENHIKAGANPEKCISFFKVGGGFKAEDYAQIRHLTEGKWMDWDPKKPPSEFIELGGGEKYQYERPDVWIRPKDSIVVSVKAASIGASPQFAMQITLRFPRFRRLRTDRTWDSALDVDGFMKLKEDAEQQVKEKKEMKIEDRKRRPQKRARREILIAGQDPDTAMADQKPAAGQAQTGRTRSVFEGRKFCVMTDCVKPIRKTKAQLESLIKAHGGTLSQQTDPQPWKYLIADKYGIKVASLLKRDSEVDIIRPNWVLDCLDQDGVEFLLPLEEKHLLNASEATKQTAEFQVDEYGDSYMRAVDVDELKQIAEGIPKFEDADSFDVDEFLDSLESAGCEMTGLGFVFRRCIVLVAGVAGTPKHYLDILRNYIRFGGGTVVDNLQSQGLTHVVVAGDSNEGAAARELAAELRHRISLLRRPPRLVTRQWVDESWKEKTLLDEEAYVPL